MRKFPVNSLFFVVDMLCILSLFMSLFSSSFQNSCFLPLSQFPSGWLFSFPSHQHSLRHYACYYKYSLVFLFSFRSTFPRLTETFTSMMYEGHFGQTKNVCMHQAVSYKMSTFHYKQQNVDIRSYFIFQHFSALTVSLIQNIAKIQPSLILLGILDYFHFQHYLVYLSSAATDDLFGPWLCYFSPSPTIM